MYVKIRCILSHFSYVAPCAGDNLTLIYALHGIKARTIREGCSSSKDADDDENESIDS